MAHKRLDAGLHLPHRDAWRRGPVPREVDDLPTTVAQALGTSRRAAEVAVWGPLNLARRCARVIAALKAAGADEALVRFLQPLDLAISAAQPPGVTDDELPGAHPVSRGREIAPAYLKRLYEEFAMRSAPHGFA